MKVKALTREIGKTALGKMEIQGYATEKKSYEIPDDVLAQYEIK